MNTKKEGLNSNTLRILYYHNKNNVVPILIIIVCLLLFLQFILPQIQELSFIKTQESAVKERVNTLQTKYNLIQSFDDSNLESNFQTASEALPPYKNYAGIINGVSKAAAVSGISLSDFSFSVGDLSTKSAALSTPPSISISLSLKGNLAATKRFIQNLSKVSPLSEVVSIQANDSGATINTLFYYKPFPPLKFDSNISIQELSEKNFTLLNTLSSWKSD